MSLRSIRRRRLGRVAVISASALLLAALLPATGSAIAEDRAAPTAPTLEQRLQRHDHAMGSQIRKHEGIPEQITAKQAASDVDAQASVYGIDVSGYQGNVDWAGQWNAGKRFVWIKATEGTGYINPYFNSQYSGSYNQGFIRGAYHFALPDRSSGAAQADYFSDHGGGWSGDGKTLPGALDMEYNPYGSTCYGLSKDQMTQWILDFSNTYKARWDKYPAIYTSASWWSQCVSGDFSSTNPLWVARYASSPGELPYNWGFYTVWQYGTSPMDQDVFSGSYERLQVFATNSD